MIQRCHPVKLVVLCFQTTLYCTKGFFYDLLTKTNKRVKSPKEMQDDVEDLVQATVRTV